MYFIEFLSLEILASKQEIITARISIALRDRDPY